MLAHAYDPLGNRIQTTLPNGRRVDTLRYGSGHWHGTLWQGRSLVDLERDALHRETTRQFGQGRERLSATRAYDPQSRLIAFSLNRGQQRLHERRYAYDLSGNLTAIDDGRRGHTAYTYDPLGQLLSAVQPTLSERFAFDPAGNLLNSEGDDKARARDPEAGLDQPGPGTQPPRLARITHNLLRQYLGSHYEYDAQGNTVLKRQVAVSGANEASMLALAYDADSQLIEAVRSEGAVRRVARYAYDAFGRRIVKEVTENDARAETTLFVWDGDLLTQEIHADKTVSYLYEPDSFVPLARIESRDGQERYAADPVHLAHQEQWDLPGGKSDPAEQVRAWRAHEQALLEARHQAFWTKRREIAEWAAGNDRIHYYHCDHLGTPLELLDERGQAVWAARYKAWGRIHRQEVREVEQPLRFQGQYEDEETGLFYNRHRYYDPDAARYLTQDPIGLLGGLNAYAYAPNPTGWVDPRGLAKKKGGCDPCCGKNPAAEAQAWLGTKEYPGVDNYRNMVLKKGSVVYGGVPGQTAFYMNGKTVINAGGSSSALGESLQIKPHPTFGHRKMVQGYLVKEDTCVAVGKASAQPISSHGAGGGTQYYIPEYKSKLQPLQIMKMTKS